MNTYIFNWYDTATDERTIMRLNEKQAELIHYLFEDLALGEILEEGNIEATLTASIGDGIVDLT